VVVEKEANRGRAPNTVRSKISRSTADRVEVRGYDLAQDLMGRINLGDMAFLELKARLPDPGESVMFNAMLVALVEHGITPSSLATRLTYVGAPESLQAAVAAGLLGLGTVFVGTIEGAARMLQEALAAEEVADLEAAARDIVSGFRRERRAIPGLGHPIHRTGDPRSARLFDLAREHGIAGRAVNLMQLVRVEAEQQTGRTLPINVTGAIGAIASDMDVPWQICRGLGVMSRSIGLVAHIEEEMHRPIGGEIWRRAEEEAGEDGDE
jgi:citrate synthase